MKIDLNNMEKSVWVEMQPGVEFLIRPLSASKRSELEEQASKERMELVQGRRQKVRKVDDQKFEELMRDWIVEDWKGLNDQDNKAIPCTTELKMTILDYFHSLRTSALNAAMDLQAIKMDQEDDNRKNSGKTSAE